jgi:hypothetical protein
MPKKPLYQKPKRTSKIISDLKINSMKKKLHEFEMDTIRENEVRTYYEEFQRFMNWSYPIDFKLEVFSGKRENRDDIARIILPTSANAPYILQVDIGAPLRLKEDYKSVLFHEFTHIYDDLTTHEMVRKSDLINPGSWYTEAHAIEIELLCSCKFLSINDAKKVALTEKFSYYNNAISILKFIENTHKAIQSQLDKEEYGAAIKRVQYYFGALRFVLKHCTFDDVELAKIKNDEYFSGHFSELIISIRNFVVKDCLSAGDFRAIRDISETIVGNLAHKKVVSDINKGNIPE